MKKYAILIMALFLCIVSNAVWANNVKTTNLPRLSVIIIGDADFKTDDFYNHIKNSFKNADYQYFYGTDAQANYEEYWFSKGVITTNPNPTVEDLFQFTNYSNSNKTLYLVVQSAVIEKHKKSRGLFGSGGGERVRANVEIKGILVDDKKLIKIVHSVQDDTSETSELRAKREAFGKCCRDIAEQLNPLL